MDDFTVTLQVPPAPVVQVGDEKVSVTPRLLEKLITTPDATGDVAPVIVEVVPSAGTEDGTAEAVRDLPPAAVTVKVKFVNLVTPPPIAVTMIGAGPIVAVGEAVKIMVVKQVGLQLGGEKPPKDTPIGIPETVNVTGWVVPESRVAVMTCGVLAPWGTEVSPGLVSEKLKGTAGGAFTVMLTEFEKTSGKPDFLQRREYVLVEGPVTTTGSE